VAGGMCLSRSKGVNLPLLSVYATMGYDVEVHPNSYAVSMDRALISCYKLDYNYKRVYIDFDDTIIIREKVNLNVIRFLYQCKNNNIIVILLTRHSSNIYDSMKKYSIDFNLFSKIIVITQMEQKSRHIMPENSIFIDNTYSERRAVQKVFGIPVFDVDAIEFLLNWET
jgi:hypothetical protein